jgi:dTDP-L-rhamnose 4-epimerase
MKIIITGGAGFIGKWIVKKLPTDIETVIIDSLDPQVHRVEHDFPQDLKERAICIQADVCDTRKYKKHLENADIIIHLAAQTGTGQSMYEMSRYVQHNVDGTAKLLETINSIKEKPKQIVLASSRAIYGEGVYTDGSNIYYPDHRRVNDLKKGKWEVYNQCGSLLKSIPMQENHLPKPVSIYGLTKLWQEQLIENFTKASTIDCVVLRLQNVYGPGQELHNPYTGIVGIFVNSIIQRNEVDLFEDGKMTRDFVYIEDVAEIMVKSLLNKKIVSKTINLGSGKPVSLAKLVGVIAKVLNKKPVIKYSGSFRLGDIRHAVADVTLLKKVFPKWSPTSLEKGLKSYVKWYLQQNPPSTEILESSLKEMRDKGLCLQTEKG